MKFNSQDLKLVFNDHNNDKEYEVLVFTSFNYYPINNVIKDGDKIYIITEEIGGELVGKEEDTVEPSIA